MLIQAHQADFVHGLAGSRHEHKKDRERPVNRSAAQLGLHFQRNEEAVAEQRPHRSLEISQCAVDRLMAKTGQLRNFARRLQAGQNVCRSAGKERSRIRKSGPLNMYSMVSCLSAKCSRENARTFESVVLSSRANIASRLRACCCHAGSLVSGSSGEPGEGGNPARNRAVSSAMPARHFAQATY